jgi:hypothetical protein
LTFCEEEGKSFIFDSSLHVHGLKISFQIVHAVGGRDHDTGSCGLDHERCKSGQGLLSRSSHSNKESVTGLG